MVLKNKKLLVLGGAAFLRDIRKYADDEGFKVICVGKDTTKLAPLADEVYAIDTKDVDTLQKLVAEKGINGVFVGANEINIPPAIELAKRTGINFYTGKEQWEVMSDKAAFKSLLTKHGLNAIPEYRLTADFNAEDLAKIIYPVLVKPADGSGARGISVAQNEEELRKAYEYAESISETKKILVERFMENMDDCFIRYHFQDGEYSISDSFDKHNDYSQGGFGGIGLGYIHPTKHLDAYLEKCDKKMCEMFADAGLKNGALTIQGFVDENEEFYFYESGYRLGGSQSYIFSDVVNGSNGLKYMINYALTGEMADYNIAKRNNPRFEPFCLNLYVGLHAGTISVFDGVDDVRNIDGVLNVTEFMKAGDTVIKTGSLNQVCLRMHLIAKDKDGINALLDKVYSTLNILDENGEDMVLTHFKVE